MKNTTLLSEERIAHTGSVRHSRRPFSVSLLMLGVLIIAGSSLVRLILSIRQWEFLAGFSGVSPAYLAASGLIWTLGFLPLSWGLFFHRFWAPQYTKLVFVAYIGTIWVERVVLTWRQARTSGDAFSLPDSMPNLVFQVVGSALLLFFVFWSLSRKKVRAYFGVNHE